MMNREDTYYSPPAPFPTTSTSPTTSQESENRTPFLTGKSRYSCSAAHDSGGNGSRPPCLCVFVALLFETAPPSKQVRRRRKQGTGVVADMLLALVAFAIYIIVLPKFIPRFTQVLRIVVMFSVYRRLSQLLFPCDSFAVGCTTSSRRNIRL